MTRNTEARMQNLALLILLADVAAQALSPQVGERTQAKIARALSAAPGRTAGSDISSTQRTSEGPRSGIIAALIGNARVLAGERPT